MEHTSLMDTIRYEFPEYKYEQHMELYLDIVQCVKMREYVSNLYLDYFQNFLLYSLFTKALFHKCPGYAYCSFLLGIINPLPIQGWSSETA